LAMRPSSSGSHQVRPPTKALPGFAFRERMP
jgi:hypothetical protein